MKNNAVARAKVVNTIFHEDHVHGESCSIYARILTPAYQSQTAVNIKVRLYRNANGHYTLQHSGEKYIAGAWSQKTPRVKVTAASVADWVTELNLLANFTFHAIKRMQSVESGLSFDEAVAKLDIIPCTKTLVNMNKKMVRISLRLPAQKTKQRY